MQITRDRAPSIPARRHTHGRSIIRASLTAGGCDSPGEDNSGGKKRPKQQQKDKMEKMKCVRRLKTKVKMPPWVRHQIQFILLFRYHITQR